MMREDPKVPRRHSPPTPRSRNLGKALRALREGKGLTAEQLGKKINHDQSWVSRVEKGLLKIRPGDVMEILLALDMNPSGDGKPLVDLARQLDANGWWQRLDALPSPLVQLISFEREATEIDTWEPILVPGLLQTPDYARAVSSIGRETDPDKVEQKVTARLNRQELLTRSGPPFLHVVISEAVLRCEVGGPDVLRDQLRHIADVSMLPNVRIQILRFQAGAHLADRGPFSIMSFGEGEADLGFVDTVTGSLFLESPNEIDWLNAVWHDIVMRSMSPAESRDHLNGLVRWRN